MRSIIGSLFIFLCLISDIVYGFRSTSRISQQRTRKPVIDSISTQLQISSSWRDNWSESFSKLFLSSSNFESLYKQWEQVLGVAKTPEAVSNRPVVQPKAEDPIEETDAVVVGSGISGSTAAFYLHKNGIKTVLVEARDVVGGNLISKNQDGFLWEEGPNSFQPNPAILRYAKDLGMIDELVLADPTLPRFVFWEGELYALPSKPLDAVSFGLLTWPGKIRAGLGALGFIAPKPDYEETVEEFVTRHLGAEAFQRIVDPFVSGVYAGDPRKLSMRAALKKIKNLEDLGVTGGILEGAVVRVSQLAEERKKNAERDADLPKIPGGSLGTFKNGLQSLPLKTQEILGDRVRVSHKLTKVTREGDKWVTEHETPSGKKILKSKVLLVTSPAYVTSKIFGGEEGLVPEASGLDEINYPPVASVTVAYPNDAFKKPLVGFGNLIPRAMKIRTLGTIWSSSLFPGRAPEGYTMLLNYIGGAQDTDIAKLSNEEIVQQVHSDVKKILLKPDAPEPKVLGVRLWPRAIPQYDRGHLDILKKIEEGCQRYTGLFLGGNFKTGVAFGDCVQYGADIASAVTELVKSSSEVDTTVDTNQAVQETVSQ